MNSSKTSPVWKYFKIDSTDTRKAICCKCNAKISRGGTVAKNFTTTNLIAHLRSQHVSSYREYEAALSSKGSATPSSSIGSGKGTVEISAGGSIPLQTTLEQCASMKEMWSSDHPRAQAISTAIGEMMALDCQPFSIVEDEGFKRLMKLVAPKYVLPSRRHFAETVLTDMYDSLRKKVEKSLSSSCNFLALTTDVWSADNAPGIALLSLTAHWIDDKFIRRYAMLHAQNLEAAHTGKYLAKVTTEMLAGWHLRKDRVQYVLRDNAPAMVKAMTVADLPSIGCMAHTLQLAVKDALQAQKAVENVIAIGRRIVGHFKHSTLAYNRLATFQKVHQLPEHRLLQDEPTRWNSTYYMLIRLKEQRSALTSYGGEYDIPLPTVSQWELIDKTITALQPIEDVTQIISADSASCSCIQPMIAVIRMALLKHPDSRGVQTMISELLASIDKRFLFVMGEKQLIVTTLLDPRFKDRFLPPEVRQRAYDWLADEVLEVEAMQRDQGPEEIASKRLALGASQSPQSSLWDAFDQVIHGSQTVAVNVADPVVESLDSNRASVQQMIRVYIAEPTIDRMSDPLKWWAENGVKKMAPVARQFLCPPATSVPSERLFSGAGLIYSDHRSRLSADKAERLMFIRTNMPLC